MMTSCRWLILAGCALVGTLLTSTNGLAWGPEEHRVIGLLALRQANPEALHTLQKLSGNQDLEVLAEACNWPDQYRATEQGAWSAPQHYLNVPRDATGYSPERDCANDQCVSGAIRTYAAELGDNTLGQRQRREAWARVCHFVGDVHQPLHAGFGEDRGGNELLVRFDGEDMTLHRFWDRALIDFNYPEWPMLAHDLEVRLPAPLANDWVPSNVEEWVVESHRLVRAQVYPGEKIITPEFAASSWLLALDRMARAANRLAQVINTTLAR